MLSFHNRDLSSQSLSKAWVTLCELSLKQITLATDFSLSVALWDLQSLVLYKNVICGFGLIDLAAYFVNGLTHYWVTSHLLGRLHQATMQPGSCTSDFKVGYRRLVLIARKNRTCPIFAKLSFYQPAGGSCCYNSTDQATDYTKRLV